MPGAGQHRGSCLAGSGLTDARVDRCHHLALDQALSYKLLDKHAGGVAIDVEPVGEVILFDSWLSGQSANW